MLLNPWFDRDLSMAGRVSFLDASGDLKHGLVDFKKPMAIIPSLAIHLDREANKNRTINAQTDLPVILGQSEEKLDFRQVLLEQLKTECDESIDEILDYEISLYDTQAPAEMGMNGEFLTSARLDNLLSCYMGLDALITAESKQGAFVGM